MPPMSACLLFPFLPVSIAFILITLAFSAAVPSTGVYAAAHRSRAPKPGRAQSTPPQRPVHERFATFLAGRDFKSVFVLQNFRQDVAVKVTPGIIVREGE